MSQSAGPKLIEFISARWGKDFIPFFGRSLHDIEWCSMEGKVRMLVLNIEKRGSILVELMAPKSDLT